MSGRQFYPRLPYHTFVHQDYFDSEEDEGDEYDEYDCYNDYDGMERFEDDDYDDGTEETKTPAIKRPAETWEELGKRYFPILGDLSPLFLKLSQRHVAITPRDFMLPDFIEILSENKALMSPAVISELKVIADEETKLASSLANTRSGEAWAKLTTTDQLKARYPNILGGLKFFEEPTITELKKLMVTPVIIDRLNNSIPIAEKIHFRQAVNAENYLTTYGSLLPEWTPISEEEKLKRISELGKVTPIKLATLKRINNKLAPIWYYYHTM